MNNLHSIYIGVAAYVESNVENNRDNISRDRLAEVL
jgi:hypothetical protein